MIKQSIRPSFSGHVGVVVLWTENVYFYEKYDKTDTGTNKLTYDGQKWDSILLTAVAAPSSALMMTLLRRRDVAWRHSSHVTSSPKWLADVRCWLQLRRKQATDTRLHHRQLTTVVMAGTTPPTNLFVWLITIRQSARLRKQEAQLSLTNHRWQTVRCWFVKLLRYGRTFCQNT